MGNCRHLIEDAIKDKGSKEKALMDDKVYKAKEEIQDLEGLLPEIQVARLEWCVAQLDVKSCQWEMSHFVQQSSSHHPYIYPLPFL